MRGKRFQHLQVDAADGLIPAHAGKTTPHFWESSHCRAHPHSRGENASRVNFSERLAGSSPLTRGKRQSPSQTLPHLGLIPAHAGKTATRAKAPRRSAAHPRSRGENPHLVTMDEIWKGSSPLTRGKLEVAQRTPHAVRLIPAHAGKTVDVAVSFSGSPAHPRSRGENHRRRREDCVITGSSPLTRGKLVLCCAMLA